MTVIHVQVKLSCEITLRAEEMACERRWLVVLEATRHTRIYVASFPGPQPASRRLQYGKAGEGLVHFLT